MKKKGMAPGLAALVLSAVGVAATPSPPWAQHSVRLAWTASSSAAANPSLTYN